MSEPKRVTFETISSGSSKNLAADASAKNEKTVRLELKLFEPNSNNYPLFNFKTLCQAEKVITGENCVRLKSSVRMEKKTTHESD